MGEHLPGAIPDGDHRGMGQAPPRRHILCDDHPIEGRRPTMGNQTASPWTPHPSCLTHLKNGSRKVSLVVRNVCDSHIFLKKGVPVAQVVSAALVPPAELSPEMEATLGAESQPEPMSVAARQEKLNLDGLADWSPENAVAVKELVLAYHDLFALESNELGCTSAIKQEIHIENGEPFKEQFWCIPPPLLEEVRASLRDMLEAGVIHLTQSPWCNVVVLVQKKDGTLHFSVDFRPGPSTRVQRRTRTLCPRFRRPWKAWWGWHISNQWISSWASGKLRWPWDRNSTQPSRWVTLGSMSLPACCLGCVMRPRCSSISCRTPWGS